MEKPENLSQIDSQVIDNNSARVNINLPTATYPSLKVNLIVDYIFWILVAVTLLRFAFKLIGANAQNVFVSLIYNFTNLIVGAFQGIVGDVTSGNMVVEFSSLISIVILWLVYRAVLRLIVILRRA